MYSTVFGQNLEAEVLAEMLHVLATEPTAAELAIVPILQGLTRVSRFNTVALFLEDKVCVCSPRVAMRPRSGAVLKSRHVVLLAQEKEDLRALLRRACQSAPATTIDEVARAFGLTGAP